MQSILGCINICSMIIREGYTHTFLFYWKESYGNNVKNDFRDGKNDFSSWPMTTFNAFDEERPNFQKWELLYLE